MNFWNKNESILFSYMCVMGIFELLNYYLNNTMITESKIPNNTCSHPNIQNDLYYQVMSRRITYDYFDYLRNIIQKHKNLIWPVTYLHKRNIKIQINGIIISMYALLIYIYIYIWQLNQTVLELDLWAVKFLFFPRRDLSPHHWYTAAPFS